MVEQTNTREGHRNPILIAGLDHIVISHAAAGLGDELHAALMGALDVVAEGEERITAQCHLRVLGNPSLLPLRRQHRARP